MQYRDTKYEVTTDGRVVNTLTGHVLTPVKKPTGYWEIRISHRGSIKHLSLHRLVWESRNGSIPSGLHINHIDGDKDNNHPDNLELVTPEQNQIRRILRNGEQVNTSKLTAEKVRKIREKKSQGVESDKLAEEYGVSKSAINRLLRRVTWAHVV